MANISFEFDERQLISPTLISESSVAISVAPDNSAISIIFDSFLIDLQSQNTDVCAAKFIGFRVPLVVGKGTKLAYFMQDVRGQLIKDAGCRVVWFIDLFGKTSVLEFPYGKQFEGEIYKRFPRKIVNPKAAVYTASFGLFVERNNLSNSVYFAVDSFDARVTDSP